MNQTKGYPGVTTTVIRNGVRLAPMGWADALQLVRRRIWWNSMSVNEKVVATVLVGAGSIITRRK